MRKFSTIINVDNSDLIKYPDGRIKDNTGSGDGTPVNEKVYGDLKQFFLKLKRLANIIENELPDNEENGFQLIEALRDFGSKHDVIQTLTTASGVITVSTKLNTIIQNNESLICKSGFNYTTETSIKGTDGTVYSLIVVGNFKIGEHVRLIKTGSSFLLIRLVDSVSADAVVSELLFLKKASQVEENAGLIDTKATTPLTNKTVFGLRVNDNTASAPYLATVSQNGLYPKEHFSIVAGLGANPLRNVGFINGVNVDSGSGSYTVGGNISAATIELSAGGRQEIICTMANAMDNTNYEVQVSIQSQATFSADVEIQTVVFRPVSTTQFRLALRESAGTSQNLKLHCRVYQL